MASTNQHPPDEIFWTPVDELSESDDGAPDAISWAPVDELSESDGESIASLETDDGQDHPPEKVLAQHISKTGFAFYLIKWQDCPLLRSSWEGKEFFNECPWIWKGWQIELQRQAEGKSQELDILAFNRAVLEIELAERQRRAIRRLKRKVNRVLSIVTD
ncbi:uncharacterized protein RSE6_05958 [Rhynchosporium secalis]|uniref:Chromo domain-containing protein n=1 Tax=Rhynchosporium secalis TaxID=38038 RepID=A0A1E1M949_RHYSE|nr:uncharacterized protein RSE6_05958 [Rhynchosporium secalis]